MGDRLLDVNDLTVSFRTEGGRATVVDKVGFHIHAGETVGIVGESGCGKTVTSLAVMRLIACPPGRISGRIFFAGQDLLQLPVKEMRKIRGNSIAMIFQEPMTSLNPVFTVGDQIAEMFRLHQRLDKKDAMDKAVEMLQMVGVPSPERRVWEYPHQMSGGMRQRVMIAMALACNPRLLIADEPTTALDVTIQAQILDLMDQLQAKMDTAIIMITHDLGVVAETCRRVIVMYAGQIVEEAGVEALYNNPLHPYTEGLLRSIPSIEGKRGRLHVIEGTVPNPLEWSQGCRFAPRCLYALDRCGQAPPLAVPGDSGHYVRCWRYTS